MRIATKAMVGFALFSIAACHRTPSGQVAATVDGDEITVSELRMEMADTPQNEENQQAALQQLIGRKLLIKEATRQNLADGPDAMAARGRAEEAALAQLLSSKFASQVSQDESQSAIDKIISDHPAQFAERRLIFAEQLIVSSGNAGLLSQIDALKAMPAIEALLTQNNVPYIKTQSIIDTAAMPPAMAAKVAGLGTDQIFLAPGPNGTFQVSRILGSRVQPLAGDDARAAARSFLNQSRAEAARTRMRAIVEQGKKRVWIDPAFGKI